MHSTISLVYTVRIFLIFTSGQISALFGPATRSGFPMKLANYHAIFVN